MSQLVTTEFGQFAVEDSGAQGQALVFLHGGAANLRAWDNVVSVLHPTYRCVCIDLPGHGQSPVAPMPFPRLSAAMAMVFDQLHLNQPVLVGHSFGGLVAAYLANSNTVATGVLAIDPYLSDKEVRGSFTTVDQALKPLEQMQWPWPETSDVDAQVQQLLHTLYSPRPDRENLRAMIRRGYRAVDTGRYIRYPRRQDEMLGVRANWSVDVTAIFSGVQCPLSVALAEYASLGSLQDRRDIVQVIAAAAQQVESTEFCCGHDVPGYLPNELAQYIDDWVRRCCEWCETDAP